MIEIFRIVLEFLRTDIFVSFGILTIPFLIGRQIPKVKESFSRIDEVACRFIIFSGIVYTIVILLSYAYIFLVIGDQNDEYAIINRAKGPYAWSFWVTLFSWLLITQSFRFKRVRKNILIRIILIPLFLFTFDQYIILITTIHRDYLPPKKSNLDIENILGVIPFWSLHLILKLTLFMVYVFLFHLISKKINDWKVVS